MALKLDMKRSLNMHDIFEIYRFEIFVQKKRYLIITILSLIIYNIYAILLTLVPPKDAVVFVANATSSGSIVLLLALFFAGGILADEFNKRTALTNFTKTRRDNFFIGKSLAAFTSVLVWIGPMLLETFFFCLILYQQVPVELFYWFGYHCLAGGMFVSIYLAHSAIFRSGSQAMMMSFVSIIASSIAFGIFGAFFGLWHLFPIYAEVAAIAIFSGPTNDGMMIIDVRLGIPMMLCYLVSCIVIAYLRFRTRDV